MAQGNKTFVYTSYKNGMTKASCMVVLYIPMYMGRIRVETMHFLVGSTYTMQNAAKCRDMLQHVTPVPLLV